MGLIKRNQLSDLLKEAQQGKHKQVYLFFGERYLCKESADALQETLIHNNSGVVNVVDGDKEDADRTLAQLMSFSLLPGRQVYRVNDSKLFHSKKIGANIWNKAVQNYEADKQSTAVRQLTALLELGGISPEEGERFAEIADVRWKELFGFPRPEGDLSWADMLLSQASSSRPVRKSSVGNVAEKYIASIEQSIPAQNILVLCAETIDKRKKLFTVIKKFGTAVDCSVAAGSGMAAQKEQKAVLKELVVKTLGGFEKKIDSRSLEMFFERVGFHPVAVVTESEKLALFVEDRQLITSEDIELMVGRSREDALFELTDAFSKKRIDRTLVILSRLLDNGIHPLAVLATLRNYIKKLLLFRSFQSCPSPVFHKTMSSKQFQDQYLPALKECSEWPDLLGGHPYALYKNFVTASEFSCLQLKQWLQVLLKAEFRVKGAPLEHKLVLEEMFLEMLRKQNIT